MMRDHPLDDDDFANNLIPHFPTMVKTDNAMPVSFVPVWLRANQ
jgi:hypothetical protein